MKVCKIITFSTKVTYLGVTIDEKLSWNTHLANVLPKGRIMALRPMAD